MQLTASSKSPLEHVANPPRRVPGREQITQTSIPPRLLTARVSNRMRLIIGISLVLFGVGSLLCEVECRSAVTPAASRMTGLVRTTDGWESPQNWRIESASPPRVHPLVVAVGQGLVSIFALVACQSDRRAHDGSANA